jgi:flavin-dependent dehydrogenase
MADLPPLRDRYDVVVLGGAFSGAAAAVLLRRECPGLSVLVVERAAAFDEKVGEATTEMSAMFLTRRLALWEHLEREQLPKEGLRYWFHNQSVRGHAEASETGGFIRSAVPAFQLRRDALDEHILATAVAEGAELARPARVADVEVGEFDHRVTIEREGPEGKTGETVACRWLLDATGRACLLGRKLGLIERNEAHPTAAVWCRWRGVRHIDDLAARGPLGRGNVTSRRLATNHYMGFGYWVWVIPLGNGETSIGVVFDTRLVDLDRGRDREAAYLAFLRGIPPLAELLEGAVHRGEDLRTYSNLAYRTRQYMGPGWALVGDAAAFLDPYYSPGLDHASFSVEATVAIVAADASGEDRQEIAARIATHNETFLRSYDRFFRAVFLDKYTYMGEQDLLSASTLLDTAQYYIFVVIPAYRIHGRFHWMPVLGPREAFLSYHLMRLYNRRFRQIALARRAAGEEGRRNAGRRVKVRFNLQGAPLRMAAKGVRLWLAAEVDLLRLKATGRAGRRAVADRGQGSELEPITAPRASLFSELRPPHEGD